MQPAILYKLAAADAQERLGQFANLPDIADLSGEIALCRALVSQCALGGQTALAGHLLAILGRLCREQSLQETRKAQYVHRSQLAAIGNRMVQALADRVAGRFDGWQDCLVEVADDLREVKLLDSTPD